MGVKLSQLIEFYGTQTDPAAETESIGLPAYAQLSWFLQSHLDSFTVTRDSEPSTGIRPSTRDYPIWQLYRDPRLSAVNRDYPTWQLCLDAETFGHLQGLFICTKSSQPSTGIVQKLMPARAAGGN
jgi:hypothetical protein